MSSQNLCDSEHYTSDEKLLKHTFSGARAFLKSQTITTEELSSLDDVTSLVAYLGIQGVGQVHNEHNSHCQDAMPVQHHSYPFYHHHQ